MNLLSLPFNPLTVLAEIPDYKAGEALEILKNSSTIAAELGESFQTLWDGIIFNTDSSFWIAVVSGALDFALIGLVIFAWNSFKTDNDNRQKIMLEGLIMVTILSILLGGNGAFTSNILAVTHGFDVRLNRALAKTQVLDLTIAQSLENISLSNASKDKVDALIDECTALQGDEKIKCLEKQIVEIEKMVKPNWDTEELIEHWTLLPQELELVENKVRGNKFGFALLLKHFQIFASFPNHCSSIPKIVISYIASQLNVTESAYSDYDFKGRSARVYRAEIRSLFDFRVATITDSEQMSNWLIQEILPNEQRFEIILLIVSQRWRELQIEPPTKLQVERLIKSAIYQYEADFCSSTLKKLTPSIIEQIDILLSTENTKETLEVLEFRSNNDLHRPVIKALELLKKYAQSKARYYDSTEEIPIDGVLKTGAKEILMETDSDGNERINRINYEICVLKALRERLCCKEIWVRESSIRQSSKTTICAYALRG